jgi:BlaI family transcriptional regulator, penicillinase repressor
MARKKSPTLTDAELRLMDVLWEKGAATVGEVAGAIPNRPQLAYSTVLTTLRILEQKGYVRHGRRGRAFVYRPVIDRTEVRRGAVRYILSRFFQDDPALLLVNILEHEKLDPEELQRLREMIEEGD